MANPTEFTKFVHRFSVAMFTKNKREVKRVLREAENLETNEDKELFLVERRDCLDSIRSKQSSLLKLLFLKSFVYDEDVLNAKHNEEFMSLAIKSDFLDGLKYLYKKEGLRLVNSQNGCSWSAIYDAIEEEKINFFDYLINEQTEGFIVNEMTVLALACQKCNIYIIKRLLRHETLDQFINKKCRNGDMTLTPLQWCLQKDSSFDLFECVKMLVNKGACINIKEDGREEETAFLMAVRLHLPEIVMYFMDKGADLHMTDSKGDTALHLICQTPYTPNSFKCLQRLIQGSPDIDIRNLAAETPFFVAVTSENLEMAEELKKNGCDVNVQCLENKETALSVAVIMNGAQRSDAKHVEKLLSFGCNVNTANVAGMTPLMLAAYYRDDKSFNLLLEKNADMYVKDKLDGLTVLDYCVQYEDKGNSSKNRFQALYNKNFSDMVDKCSKYIVDLLRLDDGDALDYLVSIGVDIHHIGETNSNILHLLPVSYTTIFYKISHLCDRADVNQRDLNGDTPLLISANANGTFIEYFLERGADVNLRNNKGQTPLMIFAGKNNKEALSLLLFAGANISIRDNEGRTAVQYLKPHGQDGKISSRYIECLPLLY